MYFSMGVVAAHLEVPLNRLKFVGGTVGGGFGGKVDTASETVCALLAIKSQRPVKWRWTREEEFLASSTRAPWHMELADAVTSDGTKHSFHHTGAYTIPNLEFNGYVVFTNRVPTTAMRGFGVTSVSFAAEMHMNRIASVLDLDPWEIRLKNANRVGDTTANWVVLKDPSTVPVMLAAAERVGVELRPEYRAMTNERRSGDVLPEHLVEQLGTGDGEEA
jgi:CO/xanthine dehydrogenase Mo-binding subunit